MHKEFICPVGAANVLKEFHKARFGYISDGYSSTIFSGMLISSEVLGHLYKTW